ncbi:MAG TPA: hypothetical protein VJY85_06715 [Candidatus Limnocylindria bacterium]|nr:hypothetical protein [Candidatus Limnocylindria bacterium]
MISSRWSALVAAVALLTGLAACGGAPKEPTDTISDVDLARATVLSTDPVYAQPVAPVEVRPGKMHSERLGWDRTEVVGQLYLQRIGPDQVDPTPGQVEHQIAAVLTKLRANGWNVHWGLCVPDFTAVGKGKVLLGTGGPSQEETLAATKGLPFEVPRFDGWEWVVFVHKVVGGVSYWGMLVAGIFEGDRALIDLVTRAPHARDSANLFATAPPVLAAGKTCAEDEQAAGDVQASGEPVYVKAWWPFPAQSRSPDPHRL